MRRWTTALAAVLLAVGVGATAVPAASAAPAAATACPTGWGSLDRQDQSVPYQSQALADVRTGAQECFDRLVLDVPGTSTANPLAYQVHYVTGNAIQQAASGTPIPVGGGAVLEIVVGTTAYDPSNWKVVYPGRVGETLPGVDLKGYRTFVDTRFGGSFEGETQIGLGVRARLPFRVFQLDNRLVVDVAHTWGAGA